MFENPNTLVVDVKLQDQYRSYIAKMIADPTQIPSTVILGDSDIDYELSPNVGNSAILNTPYGQCGIKHPLIYNGVGANLSGLINCFARQVQANGTVDSLYNYNTNLNWSAGVIPPVLANGYDWDQITFTDSQMGYVLFFESVLDYYLTSTGVQEQLQETYTFTFSWNGSVITPSNWNYVIDNTHGSLLLAKLDTTSTPIGLNYRGSITIEGQFTGFIKVVTFNY